MRHAKGASAVRSTEAIAQPAARRPEAQRRDTPKKKTKNYLPNPKTAFSCFFAPKFHSGHQK
ncbi:MAG: hypothetical protein NZ455_10110 [Bacteroidia bacterium]|nr:hypothetical protein [Bacteroidia bacterium]MDW8346155.1 hypothetical protein [Bacteroidia bacterium]